MIVGVMDFRLDQLHAARQSWNPSKHLHDEHLPGKSPIERHGTPPLDLTAEGCGMYVKGKWLHPLSWNDVQHDCREK